MVDDAFFMTLRNALPEDDFGVKKNGGKLSSVKISTVQVSSGLFDLQLFCIYFDEIHLSVKLPYVPSSMEYMF